MFDQIDDNFNILLIDTDENLQTAFLNSLDNYGNPNSFNLDKIIQQDSDIEDIPIIKSKTKTKSKTKSTSNTV